MKRGLSSQHATFYTISPSLQPHCAPKYDAQMQHYTVKFKKYTDQTQEWMALFTVHGSIEFAGHNFSAIFFLFFYFMGARLGGHPLIPSCFRLFKTLETHNSSYRSILNLTPPPPTPHRRPNHHLLDPKKKASPPQKVCLLRVIVKGIKNKKIKEIRRFQYSLFLQRKKNWIYPPPLWTQNLPKLRVQCLPPPPQSSQVAVYAQGLFPDVKARTPSNSHQKGIWEMKSHLRYLEGRLGFPLNENKVLASLAMIHQLTYI